ncbi:hypothetical protein B0T11DRAFT_352649 [Plectosphaerella cucumerina]|uniref:Uncharacterized protein n=1 Tax=Plectosphaerella cucumerina TaxID=40658 RepID=A0A8K0TM28_9PEZI|nr:hypothetical protein B0T11DRAFT_352649 [Plectosphaerella cucumerina]
MGFRRFFGFDFVLPPGHPWAESMRWDAERREACERAQLRQARQLSETQPGEAPPPYDAGGNVPSPAASETATTAAEHSTSEGSAAPNFGGNSNEADFKTCTPFFKGQPMAKSGPGFEITDEISMMEVIKVKGSEVLVAQSKSMIKAYDALDMKLLWQKDSYSCGFPTLSHFTGEGCASPDGSKFAFTINRRLIAKDGSDPDVKDLEDLDIVVLDTLTGEVLGASENRCITLHVDIDAVLCISHSNKTIASFDVQGSAGSSMHLQSFPLPGPAATVSAPSSNRSTTWLNHSHEHKKEHLEDISISYSPDDMFILLFCWHEGERTTHAPTVAVEAISISTNTSTSHTLPCDLIYGGDFSKTYFNSSFHFPGNRDTWLVAYALSSHPILRVLDVMTGSLVAVIRSKPSLLFNPGLKNYQWATGLLYDGKVWRHTP